MTIAPKRRIIIADESAHATEALAVVLRQSGCEVLQWNCHCGLLTAVRNFRPDVVFSDLLIEGRAAGIELAQYLRRQRPAAGCVAVALTACVHAAVRQRALAVGFDTVVWKPANPNTLIQLALKGDRRRRCLEFPAEYDRRDRPRQRGPAA
ncbi:MAG TPA: response regulator [Burkholderiaceae bacterium]|jgi:two-component system, OmpR family, response regulator MtrA|nr:response regulator [Burkholderiaceae bacterium]